jgi:hypothetical protein
MWDNLARFRWSRSPLTKLIRECLHCRLNCRSPGVDHFLSRAAGVQPPKDFAGSVSRINRVLVRDSPVVAARASEAGRENLDVVVAG